MCDTITEYADTLLIVVIIIVYVTRQYCAFCRFWGLGEWFIITTTIIINEPLLMPGEQIYFQRVLQPK